MSTDTDIENRLDDIEEKVDQSYKILRSIKQKQTVDFWFGILKTLVFIAVFYSLYLFVQPAYDQIRESYIRFQGFTGSVESLKENSMFDFLKRNQE